MASSPAKAAPSPRAVLFDAYGTLFDVYSVGLAAEQLFPGQGEQLALLWRDKQIDYTRLCSMSGRYRPFWELTRAGLRFAAAKLKLPLDPAAEERLMNQYRHLSAFPENREVLAELKRRGIPTGILSNGDPQMLDVAVKSAGFAELLTHVLSVHAAQCFKTDPAAYALGPQALGCRRARSSSSPATAGTPSAPPGTATRRCGSTAAAPARTARHRTHAHRPQPARRARFLSFLILSPVSLAMTDRTPSTA
jgi:2-haloacid dehalogenase